LAQVEFLLPARTHPEPDIRNACCGQNKAARRTIAVRFSNFGNVAIAKTISMMAGGKWGV
jgi:hypothetical protein